MQEITLPAMEPDAACTACRRSPYSGSTSEMLTVSHSPGHSQLTPCISRRPLPTVSLSLRRQTLRAGLLGAAHVFVCLLSRLMARHVASCACSLQVKPARGGGDKTRGENSLKPFMAGGILFLLREERPKKKSCYC